MKRRITTLELSDKLRKLKTLGIRPPTLNKSKYSPTYLGNRGRYEVYRHAGSEVCVGPGQVIDTHGNVIYLAELDPQIYSKEK